MTITYLHKAGWLVALVLLQALILNNLHIGGFSPPFLLLYPLLEFAAGLATNQVRLWAFFLGVVGDLFYDTPRPVLY